ncbi:MAG TPA: response regulator [Chloroflexota bacterium]|nr:response regulator [Chloroflexota bacterium]
MPEEVGRGDILIVDDEPDIVAFLSAVLSDEGLPIRTAKNGREALTQVRDTPPALIILDLMMPEVSGFEVLDTLQADSDLRAIPVIVLSAKSSHRDILDALQRGAEDFVPKPFDLDDLLLRVRVWMDRTSPKEAGATTLRVHALAPFRALVGDTLIIDENTGDAKIRLILKYLVTHPNEVVDRDALLYMVWPDLDPEAASKELDQRLKTLVELLHTELPDHQYIVEDGSGLRLDTSQDYWCDADEFEAQVRLAAHAQESGEMEAALGTFLNALSLYNEDFLHENLYEDWPSDRREKLRELWISALFRSGAICADRCEFSDSIRFMKRVLDVDPYRENAYQALMLYLTRAGRRSEAIQLYRYAERLFAQHLAAQPAPSTRMLYEKILRGEAG